MFRIMGFALCLAVLSACGSKGGDASAAMSAFSSVFGSQTSRGVQTAASAVLKSKVEKEAWIARFQAARGVESFQFTCSMFTGMTFCGGGGTEMEAGDGTTAITCTENSGGGNCNIACDGTGKSVAVACGDETVTFTDMKFGGTFKTPTCTDDGTNLTISYCMAFTEMTSKVTYGSFEGNTLACGNADGSQQMCNSMTVPKTITATTSATDFGAAPSAESTLACTVDGEAIEMDFDTGCI